MTRALLVIGLFLLALGGCRPKPGGPDWIAALKPDTSPPARADLLLAGTRIPVDVKTYRRAKEFVIELSTFGEVMETEKYISSPEEFAVREALGEVFDPAITLLKPGLELNEKWRWSGSISSGGVDRKAAAEVFMAEAAASPDTLQFDSIKVIVLLKIDSGEGLSAERGLAFYFVPNKGLLRRDFGHGSTRLPEGPPKEQER